MHSDDLEQFRAVMRELCAAFNRPYTEELAGVFFDSLKSTPFKIVRNRAEIVRRTVKKFPVPADLRPQKEPAQIQRTDEPTAQQQLMEFAVKKYFRRIPDRQFSQPWTYRYREGHDANGKRTSECVAVEIPALGDSPGKRVTLEDMARDWAA